MAEYARQDEIIERNSTLEQQVINQLSNNPNSDAIVHDLRKVEESLRRASRRMYDIQDRQFSSSSTGNYLPAPRDRSNPNALLKQMLYSQATPINLSQDSQSQPSSVAQNFDGLMNSGLLNSCSVYAPSYTPPLEVAHSTVDLTGQSSSPIPHSNVTLSSDTASGSEPSTSAAVISPSKHELACPICFETFSELRKKDNDLCSTICGHMFCRPCITEFVKQRKQCPTCRKRLNKKQFHNIYLSFV